ncbi:MAG TPA: hypothetical protein VEH27_14240 [Methylomirabilota bacterium]|nr:hypothetical protein [Methylomirabilota bacterium]
MVTFAMLWACAVGSLHDSRAGGTIEGVVPLTASASAPAASAGRYQVKASGPIAAPQPSVAIVYLEGAFAPSTAAPQQVMPQKDFQFAESVLPVQKGATVAFPNLDDDYHNVFSYSKPKRFDLGRYKKEEKAPSITFDQPGLVKLYCEIHEHMRASILVLDTPHFTRTSTNGHFVLTNIPAGEYTLKAWLDEKRTLSQPVKVSRGQVVKASFSP